MRDKAHVLIVDNNSDTRDIVTPGRDGIELLSVLRSDARLRDVSVILMPESASEEARIEGLRAGADDYLITPFAGRELVARVRLHLLMPRRRARV